MSLPLELVPSERSNVMDLLAGFGFDVKHWSNWEGGAFNPQSNPKYCYRWCFLDAVEGVVLNLWQNGMIEIGDEIEHRLTLFADQMVETDSTRRGRRNEMIDMISKAYKENLRIRIIVLNDLPPAGRRTKTKRVRCSDSQDWWIKSFDPQGIIVLARGGKPKRIVDQFDVIDESDPIAPNRKPEIGSGFVRSPEVRRKALKKSNGICQYCNCPGFDLIGGGVYLETHHVIPLGHNGPDHESNVVALCAAHHREVHYGLNRENIEKFLMEILFAQYGRYPKPANKSPMQLVNT